MHSRFAALALVTLSACAPETISTPTSTSAPGNAPATPTITVATTPARGAPTPTRPVTPTARPTPTCPEIGPDHSLNRPDSLAEFDLKLWDYLNAGGDPAALTAQLADLGMAAEVAFVDLDADLVNELFVLVDYLASPEVGHESAVWAFRCTESGNYAEPQSVMGGYYTWTPAVQAVADLTGDGQVEVVIQGTWSGSGCELALAVITMVNDQFVDLMAGKRMPNCPATVDLDESSGSDPPALVLRGQTSSSIGGGPARGVSYRYSWRQSAFALIDEQFEVPTLRIHVLEDAERALTAGQFEEALRLYEQAARDDTLINVPSYHFGAEGLGTPSNQDRPEKYQPAFALFRLGAIHLFLGQDAKFERVAQELQREYPADTPGGEFGELLRVLQASVDSGVTFAGACREVTESIHQNFPELDQHIGQWGYNNLSYVANTICPFGEQ